ncbi:MAG: diaminopimelate epimerase, partial [Bacteroidales bacterium]|nr:diaminopimelate epimerase [Bacteroidales bacterium]
MHGIGNDYVYINCFEETLTDDPVALAPILSNRHTGIGGDGIILILPSDKADARMRIFNIDGSEAEMCGNGLRCVAKYVFDHKLASSRGPFSLPGQTPCAEHSLCLETGNGLLTVGIILDEKGLTKEVCVNMGTPSLAPTSLPIDLPGESVINHEIDIANTTMQMTCVSMGNPHAVFFVEDIHNIPLREWGPHVENHPLFPQRTNAHFVKVVSPTHLIVKTWERGSGITQACGTGACACAVAAVLTDRAERDCTTSLPGGDLTITWHESDNRVYMTGPAEEVFTGTWSPR